MTMARHGVHACGTDADVLVGRVRHGQAHLGQRRIHGLDCGSVARLPFGAQIESGCFGWCKDGTSTAIHSTSIVDGVDCVQSPRRASTQADRQADRQSRQMVCQQ
jgi:hypothetical protein